MPKQLIDILAPTNLQLSLHPDFAEALHSLPGIGIISACKRGDTTKSSYGCPHLMITLPKGVSPSRADLDRVFKDTQIIAMFSGNAIGRNTLMLFHPNELEEDDDSEWWRDALAGLQQFALPDYGSIGPFDVYYHWITDPTHRFAESFGLSIIDQISKGGVVLDIEVVGGVFMRALFECENIDDKLYERMERARRERPDIGQEEYRGMGFDQVVDMIMQLAGNMDGFPWSRAEVRQSLMTALHRCVQIKG